MTDAKLYFFEAENMNQMHCKCHYRKVYQWLYIVKKKRTNECDSFK